MFGGKICYKLKKIIYFFQNYTDAQFTTHVYCVLISFPYVWILVAMLSVERVISGYHAYMDSNWRLKNLTDMTGTLW